MCLVNQYSSLLTDSENIGLFSDLIIFGPPNRDVHVFSEKMKNALIHYETEFAVFMKSIFFCEFSTATCSHE